MGLWNLFEDPVDGLTVKINGPYRTARFVNCTGVYENGAVTLTSPLHPYAFAGVELS